MPQPKETQQETPLTRHSAARSSLKRSDSYKAARPILSPEVVRRSVESSTVSSAVTSPDTSVNMSLDISNSSADVPKEIRKDGTGNNIKISETKGNFFKNIRSQFSFSSLRRSKSSKKALNKDSKKTAAESKSDSEESSLKRSQSFSTASPVAKTPVLKNTIAVSSPNSETWPRMTS